MRDWKYRTNGEHPIHIEDDQRERGSTDWRLIVLIALLTANLVIGGWWGYQGWRWQRKMAVADRIMAAQRERVGKYLAVGDCGRLVATLDTAAQICDPRIPSSMSQQERNDAFLAALAAYQESKP